MVKKHDTAMVKLWDELVGAVTWLDEQEYALFEYDPTFLKKGWDIAPLMMSIKTATQGDTRFAFPHLNKATYFGLPGLLADALPDKFGHRIVDTWLAKQGRDPASFSPVERLCYLGARSMGALEFIPALEKNLEKSVSVEVSALVTLAKAIMNEKNSLNTQLGANDKERLAAITDILRVGTSAGGVRPKAIIAMSNDGNILSGQTQVPVGYDYWILKFDGVTDLELGKPRSFGRIEYAYYLMAKAAGITMTECRLLEENGRAHFMTKRFDRYNNQKQHIQTLCGIAHFDFNLAGAYSYEQLFTIMRQLKLPKTDAQQQYRRMLFNIMAKNLDDHTKNISFIMDEQGSWRLSPAYDMTYAHNPAGQWTNQHQMSLNHKRNHFTIDDFMVTAELINIESPQQIIDEVTEAIAKWPIYAKEAGLNATITEEIQKNHYS